MIQDAINEMAEMIVKKKDEYIKARLNEMGYSSEYLRFHRYDIIPVQYACEEDNFTLICVVDAVEEKELFWFVETLRSDGDAHEVAFVPFDISRIDDETHQDAMETAKKARKQALEKLKSCPACPVDMC